MRISVLLGLLALSGCSLLLPTNADSGVCTLEFRTYAVQVVDAQGVPVDRLETTSIVLRTNEILASDPGVSPAQDGRYLVATDADRGAIQRSGDVVRFTAEGPGLRAEATFEFYDDGCHVVQRSGPAQVVAEPAGG